MSVVRVVTKHQIQEHFCHQRIHQYWEQLVLRQPGYFRFIWECARSPQCCQKAQALKLTPDELHRSLIEGLVTFHWAAGDRITKELIEVGQFPFFISLIEIQTPIIEYIEQSIEEACPDQQSVDITTTLIFFVIEQIASEQAIEKDVFFMMRLVDELKLPSYLYQCLTNLIIQLKMGEFEFSC